MSEMRQRRGPQFCPECGAKLEGSPKFCGDCGHKMGGGSADDADARDSQAMATGGLPAGQEAAIKEIQEKLLESVIRQPKPGLSHDAKQAKDALEKDPSNLRFIYELGRAYAVDEHWSKCANVMMRGWKRMGEVDDQTARFEFLLILCQASYKCRMYKQALAILNDADEPEEPNDLKRHLVMSCQVYSQNGDAPRALKAFNRAMEAMEGESDDFDAMMGAWAACMSGLRKVGAFEAAKSAVDQKMTTDEQRAKLSALEKITDVREQLEQATQLKPVSTTKRNMLIAVIFFVFVLSTWGLYHMEAHSLSKMIK